MKKDSQKKNRAFTLIETLVAVSIFSTSILGLFSVLSKSISDTNYAKTKIIASYLAQEGIEYMRNMRDTFVLYSATSQTGWDAFNAKLINASCQVANGCYLEDQDLDYNDNSQPMTKIDVRPCAASCPHLFYNSATGKYGYVASGTTIDSGYIRTITIQSISNNEMKIASTVSWTQGSGNYSMTFSENLFNWVQ